MIESQNQYFETYAFGLHCFMCGNTVPTYSEERARVPICDGCKKMLKKLYEFAQKLQEDEEGGDAATWTN